MKRQSERGSALVTAMTVLFVVTITGSGVLSLSLQSMRRGRLDTLRAQALSLAEAGAEKAVHYIRTQAPDGSTDGSWRTSGRTEAVAGQGDYTLRVQSGTGDNAGKIVITSTGQSTDGTLRAQRSVRVVMFSRIEDVSVWNNAIFGGVGQSGRSINGNVVIRGSVHLLGDGEPYTDLDGDGHWDAGEGFTDANGNGVYDPGEAFTDSDGDGHRDPRETFQDTNGNGVCDPPLTVTDLASDLGGTSNIGNSYDGMSNGLRSLIPALDPVDYRTESLESLNARLRVKHGRVDINGNATVGFPQQTGGSPAVKETMDDCFVSDGYGGNDGASHVYSDNGTRMGYDLGEYVHFPSLVEPVVRNGVHYDTFMDYQRSIGMVIDGDLNLRPGTAYPRVSDGRGNSFSVDASGNISITGLVYVRGNVRLDRDGGNRVMRYNGRGTLVSEGSVYVNTDLLPTSAMFPINHVMGICARRRLELATQGGDSQLTLAGAFYAQEQIVSAKQNEIAGSFVSSYYSMTNVPHMYQVPSLVRNLPPGMPGDQHILIHTVRIDSWKDVG